MSVYVMSQVWKRYPNGGGEMLLALALADHSHDDGTHIWPSIKQLAAKTRQSERTVQYQLRNMEASGWLLLVNAGNGGRSMHREYHICPNWLGGAEIAPPKKGANGDGNGATDDAKGATAIAPADNHQKPSKEPPTQSPLGDDVCPPLSSKDLVAEGVDKQVAQDWMALRKAKRLPLTRTAWDDTKAEAEKAGMSPAEAVKTSVQNNWAGFRAKWLDADRQGKGGAWWLSYETKLAKAIEVGVGAPNPGENEGTWEARIRAAIDNGGKPPAPTRPARAVEVRDPGAEGEDKPSISESNRAAMLAAAGIRRPRKDGDQPQQVSA